MGGAQALGQAVDELDHLGFVAPRADATDGSLPCASITSPPTAGPAPPAGCRRARRRRPTASSARRRSRHRDATAAPGRASSDGRCRGSGGRCRSRCARSSRRRETATARAARATPAFRTGRRARGEQAAGGGGDVSARPIGSAKASRVRKAGAGRRGWMVSAALPSAWSRRRTSRSPKRCARGARGMGSRSPMRRRPSRRRVSAVVASRRSASTGRAASSARWPATGASRSFCRSAKRASAQAAPAVSAIAARTVKPCRARRVVRSASRARSPSMPGPKRWPQPVTSSISPPSPPKLAVAMRSTGGAASISKPESTSAPPSGSIATQGV